LCFTNSTTRSIDFSSLLFPIGWTYLAPEQGPEKIDTHIFLGEYKAKIYSMPSAHSVRRQIETSLADRLPSALSPLLRPPHRRVSTGIRSVDELLHGGFPVGAITELVGAECSGRTSLAFSFLARRTQDSMSCAWVDISGSFDPESAAANGITLNHLLWIRCGQQPVDTSNLNPVHNKIDLAQYNIPPIPIKGLHGGAHGPHPQTEGKGLPKALSSFLQPSTMSQQIPEESIPSNTTHSLINQSYNNTQLTSSTELSNPAFRNKQRNQANSPWSRLDQAMRVTDLLLEAGGFSSIVFDAGSVLPEHLTRVPLATWFRYRSTAERTQTSLVLLTQHSCSKSSAALVLNLSPGKQVIQERNIFSGLQFQISVMRGNASPEFTNVIPLNSPRHSKVDAQWKSYTPCGYHE
jgi:recombination protein RecA